MMETDLRGSRIPDRGEPVLRMISAIELDVFAVAVGAAFAALEPIIGRLRVGRDA